MNRPVSTWPISRRLAELWYEDRPSAAGRALLRGMAPASWMFEAGARARAMAYEQGWLPVSEAPLPVLSVGNLTVGGAGKTPVVIELAQRLLKRGLRPAVLSRGYGLPGMQGREMRVVCSGSGPVLPFERAGDEPLLIARRCPGGVVLAGPDRIQLATLAHDTYKADLALLDDGFSHRRLARDLELLVIDASAPLGNGRSFPSGPLREPVSALNRAQLVWLTRSDEVGARPLHSEARLSALLARLKVPQVRSRYRAQSLVEPSGREQHETRWLEGKKVFVLAGVARPQSFLRTLTACGARVVGQALFGDHHAFSAEDLDRVQARARAKGAFVLTTEKDAARLPEGLDPPILALRIGVEILQGEEAVEAALDGLTGGLSDKSGR